LFSLIKDFTSSEIVSISFLYSFGNPSLNLFKILSKLEVLTTEDDASIGWNEVEIKATLKVGQTNLTKDVAVKVTGRGK
jgi:hypothetical protein